MTMGEKLLKLRKARGWSQEEMAEQLGVTRQAVSRWESDAAKPDADNIISLCGLFGITSDYLLCIEEPMLNAQAAPAAPAGRADRSELHRLIIGIVFLILSTLMFFALALISAIDPWTYSNSKYCYRGIMGYILTHDMQWLMVCIIVLFAAGLVMLLWKYIRQLWNWLRKTMDK